MRAMERAESDMNDSSAQAASVVGRPCHECRQRHRSPLGKTCHPGLIAAREASLRLTFVATDRLLSRSVAASAIWSAQERDRVACERRYACGVSIGGER